MTSVFPPPPPPPLPVYADLETSEGLDLSLTPNTPVVVPFAVFTVNSGPFAFTSGGAFTMPRDGSYEATLTFTVFNSADTDTEMESSSDTKSDPPPPGPAQLIAFMAYSGVSIANTTTFFKIQPAESQTCVVKTIIVDYKAGTEINTGLQAGADTSLLLQDADLSVKLIG
jgi:hypothetical protein